MRVTRWRRYGKDRLYVEGVDGAKVGWWDLASDEAHPESPELMIALLEAVTGWKGSSAQRTSATASPQEMATEPVHADAVVTGPVPEITGEVGSMITAEHAGVRADQQPWTDLSQNRAGAAARQQALAAREAAPVKTVIARMLGVKTDERAWRIGADGEEKVAAQLSRLARKDPRWHFLHAIPVGERGSDIDHLAIGPGGVYTINAKHHPRAKIWVGGNTLMVNGQRQPYVRNSRHEAARAARLLTEAAGFPVEVHGVIVTVNAEDVVIREQPEDVTVVLRMQIARWLRRRPVQLTEDHVEPVHEAARRLTTWQPGK